MLLLRYNIYPTRVFLFVVILHYFFYFYFQCHAIECFIIVLYTYYTQYLIIFPSDIKLANVSFSVHNAILSMFLIFRSYCGGG